MIIQWKRIGPDLVARWNNHNLTLKYEPSPSRPPWQIYVDGNVCRTWGGGVKQAAWWSPAAAMEALDSVANELVAKWAGKVAEQRAPSSSRVVRHA